MGHKIYPVIHVQNTEQAIRNTLIAKDAKCDGVFLINHAIRPEKLVQIHAEVTTKIPDWWIGINCLGWTPDDIIRRATPEMNGIWVDNAGVDERTKGIGYPSIIKDLRKKVKWEGLYFGGVAFKYQRPVEDLETACKLAKDYMDVVTTSGPGTAQEADVNKIARMHKALGDFPLAIASGITIDNIENYLDKATHFLVASGINETWDDLNPTLVRQLVNKVRNYK